MTPHNWRREIAIGAAGLGFGLLVLPFAIYLVGQPIIGDYGGGGPMELAERIWMDALSLEASAWLLVLGPYAIVQLVRATVKLWRRRAPL